MYIYKLKNYTFISKTDITLMDKIQGRRVRASNLSNSLLILQGPDNNHTALQEYYLLDAYNGLSWTAKGCLNTFRLRTEDSPPPTVPWQVAIGIRAQRIHRNCCFTRHSTFDGWEKCQEMVRWRLVEPSATRKVPKNLKELRSVTWIFYIPLNKIAQQSL